jgi:hypothetical protein
MNGIDRVLDALLEHAKAMGCYKVILDCSEENVAFYQKCGLMRKEVQMVGAPLLRCVPAWINGQLTRKRCMYQNLVVAD